MTRGKLNCESILRWVDLATAIISSKQSSTPGRSAKRWRSYNNPTMAGLSLFSTVKADWSVQIQFRGCLVDPPSLHFSGSSKLTRLVPTYKVRMAAKPVIIQSYILGGNFYLFSRGQEVLSYHLGCIATSG